MIYLIALSGRPEPTQQVVVVNTPPAGEPLPPPAPGPQPPPPYLPDPSAPPLPLPPPGPPGGELKGQYPPPIQQLVLSLYFFLGKSCKFESMIPIQLTK